MKNNHTWRREHAATRRADCRKAGVPPKLRLRPKEAEPQMEEAHRNDGQPLLTKAPQFKGELA